MVLGYDVHSTDCSSLILGSSEDDEVIQEGLLRLRSVFSIASYTADFVSLKLRYRRTCAPRTGAGGGNPSRRAQALAFLLDAAGMFSLCKRNKQLHEDSSFTVTHRQTPVLPAGARPSGAALPGCHHRSVRAGGHSHLGG